MSRAAQRERIKVLIVAAYPVQYASPQFVRYSEDPRLDVMVAYLSMRGATETFDPEFGHSVRWDVPLLDGYRWIHPPDRAGRWMRRIIGAFNPGLWKVSRRGFDAVVCYGYRSASAWVACLGARSTGAKLL